MAAKEATRKQRKELTNFTRFLALFVFWGGFLAVLFRRVLRFHFSLLDVNDFEVFMVREIWDGVCHGNQNLW